MSERAAPISRGVYRLALATSSLTIVLLMAGAMVTNNNAGDSVPDWPLAYGHLIPPYFVGGIRFEYTHRVIAGIVSIMTLILAIWIARVDRRSLARRLGWTTLGLVVAQAALGGVRVLEGDPRISATAHATLAQIFLLSLVSLTLYVSPWWQSDLPRLDDHGSPQARTLALWTTIAIVVQIFLGAAFRHGALGILPHVIGAGVVTVLVVWTGRAVKKRFRQNGDLRRATILLHAFFGLQILLGLAAWRAMTDGMASQQPTWPFVTLMVAHVLGGALLLTASVLMTGTCYRLIHPAGAGESQSARARADGSPERAKV